jgi:hypothetical protein
MSLLLLGLVALQSAAEVRQIVSFRFLPGKSAEAIQIFREEALPLYQANGPMLRFRACREVESRAFGPGRDLEPAGWREWTPQPGPGRGSVEARNPRGRDLRKDRGIERRPSR